MKTDASGSVYTNISSVPCSIVGVSWQDPNYLGYKT